MTSCGIYCITNLLTGKSYVGQSIHIEERIKRHKQCPKENSHYPLYQDIKNFGVENFNFEILETCPPEQLNEKEIYWIAKLDTYYNGYNRTKGGSNGGHIAKITEEELEEIIDLLQYSSLAQKDIAKMFDVGDDTISEINQGKSRYNVNLHYPLRNNRAQEVFCCDCGKPISRKSIRCLDCENKRRGQNLPDREVLKNLIRTTPFTKIGAMYGVSDNAIRKWCDKYGLPRQAREIKKISSEDWDLL